MADKENPLIQALPPESDYITYLTIIEYHLTQENLPVLHHVLQDETLTTNIGWDLVHLLVPHLPESEQCLRDVARLGNPREVILKVTESLRLIEYDEPEDEEPDTAPGASDARVSADKSTYPLKTAATTASTAAPGSSQAVELPEPPPLAISQFIALLSMLAILHPRIKTKFPSRFLSTTLQAILASFSNAATHREEMIEAIVKTVKSIRGIQRPTLPSRKSSGMLTSKLSSNDQAAADPEASLSTDTSFEESAMQTKLLQSFVTHIIEEYMLNLPSYDNVPGMAWCSRIMEKMYPERTIKALGDRFASEEKLHRRIDAVGQLVSLAQDLKISNEQIMMAAVVVEKVALSDMGEDDPPNSADDIPLSRLGSLLLYAARQASAVLYDRSPESGLPFDIFPDHQELIKHCLASHEMGHGQLGTEPEALIDSVLALGLVCLERDAIGEPADDNQFNEYLQTTSLLSANCPNPNLRGHAHYLSTTVLRSQPDEEVRLAFIRDTLEHCPFENLKVSAVGWIKGETIEANPPTSTSGEHAHAAGGSRESVFTRPIALESLAPYLFPSLHIDLVVTGPSDAWMTFQANVSFYLASLNFLYLLLNAKHLHQALDIPGLWSTADVAGSFLQPLREANKRFAGELADGGALAAERNDSVIAELKLLNETLERVTSSVQLLNAVSA